jgi:putative DNA primase/helicase
VVRALALETEIVEVQVADDFEGALEAAKTRHVEAGITERRLLLPVKNNIGPRAAGLGYRLEQTIVSGGIVMSRVAWDSSPVTVTANEAMKTSHNPESSGALTEAKEFLQEQLSDGPKAVKEIERLAADLEIKARTLRRARKELGVKTSKDGYSEGWSWSLPAKE